MLEVMHEPRTINELSHRLHRNRSAISKDVGLLEKAGLLVSQRQANPGHGIQNKETGCPTEPEGRNVDLRMTSRPSAPPPGSRSIKAQQCLATEEQLQIAA
jgi:hypothetical protein